MTDTWEHAGVVALRSVTSIETVRNARLAALAAKADDLRQRADTASDELRQVMEEMGKLSRNYAAEYVQQVKRERRYKR